jgi:hypothetical protein
MHKYRIIRLLTLVGLVTAVGAASLKTLNSGAALTRGAQKYLATLTDEQKTIAVMPYDTPQRVGWHFIPKDQRKGLQIKHMNAPQREAAFGLLQTALSQAGYDKARKIMALEGILRELEKEKRGGAIRDPERYYVTVFGEPRADSRWGLSVEGHHLSLNFVVQQGRVTASTPTFFGSNPNVVRQELPGVPPPGTRVLEQEEQRAFALIQSLDTEQRRTAIIAEKAPADIRAAGEAQSPAYVAEGLAYPRLTAAQQQQLRELIAVYANNLPEDVGSQRLQEIDQAGWDRVFFAWAGADRPGVGHYYRIQGPTFVIEFVNTQPDAAGNPASHIHSVWRDPRGDFAVPAGR